MDTSTLQPLFQPNRIAVIGASSTTGKLGHVMAEAVSTYQGGSFNINPSAESMYSSVEDAVEAAGEEIDLVISCIPAAYTADALRRAADNGVRAALICAGGFAEAGGPGVSYQNDVEQVVRDTGIRVLGPNTSGFFVPNAGLHASFVPGVEQLMPGKIGVVSSSGGVNHATCFSLQRGGAGVSLGVGLGAGFDVATPEVVEYLATDTDTAVIALHLETVSDGDTLLSAVRSASAIKPVVVLVIGENDITEFAKSHTGALATSWRVTRSVLRQAGAVLVDSEIELVNAAIALSGARIPPQAAPGVGLITGQAGPGMIIADRLTGGHRSGLPSLRPETTRRLQKYLPPLTYQANPVDTGRPTEDFAKVIRIVADDPGVDAVGVYGILEPIVNMVTSVDEAASDNETPMILGVDGLSDPVHDTQRAGQRQGVPTLTGPTALAQGLNALVLDSRACFHRNGTIMDTKPSLAVGPGPWDEAEAKQLLSDAGVQVPPRMIATDRSQAMEAYKSLNTPVAVKMVDATVLHKTEIGGVHLGVSNEDDMDAAITALETAGAATFLIEEMASQGVDLVVGARRDDVFGPMVLVGLGGTAAEAFADVSLRLAPVPEGLVAEMVDELRGAKLLHSWRGGPSLHIPELHRVLSLLGATLIENPHVDEIEINPLRLTSSGLVALDAVILASS